ncbi:MULTISPECIES: GNAT family N-acetyltransferase [unclassified Nonomuraea]|uniref:GNAT family N-acetyltransferase n=1 Tax=unclassified Nonomuraea TaxID=2593643 RepID=UPI00340C86DB
MSVQLDVPVLAGSLVRLEPPTMEHAVDLAAAAEEDRVSYGFTLVPSGRQMRAYVATQLARRGLTPFAQIRVRDGKAVGCTGFRDPRPWPDRPALRAIEIGFTWLAPGLGDVRGGRIRMAGRPANPHNPPGLSERSMKTGRR